MVHPTQAAPYCANRCVSSCARWFLRTRPSTQHAPSHIPYDSTQSALSSAVAVRSRALDVGIKLSEVLFRRTPGIYSGIGILKKSYKSLIIDLRPPLAY